MARLSVFWQVFLGVLAVALGAVGLLGGITRYALSAAFDAYLQAPAQGLSPMGRPRGMGGRMLLGAAEESFLSAVDRSVAVGALAAIALSIVAAYLIARHLTRPVRALEEAALALADGDLSNRVQAGGPEEISALGEAFNHMADTLEQSEELRRRLVADVAHELRNPIAAARAQAEGMAEGVLTTDARRLDSLVEDMAHLSALVDDLQELAVAEAGRLRYDMAPVDLAGLVAREVERARHLAAPGVTVAAALPDSAVTVTGDERRLSEVLRNLLANATRHTRSGTVTVHVEPGPGPMTRVWVVDTGEGIPTPDLPYVFERFYRADTARATDTGGAGLGLAISARIVRDHGGSVFAENTPGGGATVGFTLPA
jgi:signal transduction histidine kinase